MPTPPLELAALTPTSKTRCVPYGVMYTEDLATRPWDPLVCVPTRQELWDSAGAFYLWDRI